ncbi:MAG: hypothetical protein U0136_21755 [Bdellovibrionota bacterium]
MRLFLLLLSSFIICSTAQAQSTVDPDADSAGSPQCPFGQVLCSVTDDACLGTFDYCATAQQCELAGCVAELCTCVKGTHPTICIDYCKTRPPQIADDTQNPFGD